MSYFLGLLGLFPMCVVYYSVLSYAYVLNHTLFGIAVVVLAGFWASDIYQKVRPSGFPLTNFEQESVKKEIVQTVLRICEKSNVKPPPSLLKRRINAKRRYPWIQPTLLLACRNGWPDRISRSQLAENGVCVGS